MEMQYCPACGTRLRLRDHRPEPPALYCERCEAYRFPIFQTAVSAVVIDPAGERMILIRQYGESESVFVAGYIDKGETAEEALVREVREELGMTVRSLCFLRSHYYAPSETLMLHYAVTVEEEEARPNWEVDAWEWVPVDEAGGKLRPDGLAEILLRDYLESSGREGKE